MNRNGHPLKNWLTSSMAKFPDVRMTQPSLFSNPTESPPGTWLLPYGYWLWRGKRAWAESYLSGLIRKNSYAKHPSGKNAVWLAELPRHPPRHPPVDTSHPAEKHWDLL